MSRKGLGVGAAGLVVFLLAFSGCGGTDPTPAVNALSERYTSDLQRGLVEELGLTPAQAEGAGITVKCPDSVTEGEPFDCTITGTPGGESRKAEMDVEGDTIDFTNESSARAAVDEVFESVAVALTG